MNTEKVLKDMAALEAAGYTASKGMQAFESMPLSGTYAFTGDCEVKAYDFEGRKTYSVLYPALDGQGHRVNVSKTYLFGRSWKRNNEIGVFTDYNPRVAQFDCPTTLVGGKLLYDIAAGSTIEFKDAAGDGKVFVSVFDAKSNKLTTPKEREHYSIAVVTLKQ